MKGKILTFAEVAPHNDATDCWIIIDGKVYDVTKFLEKHPGGSDVLVGVTGKDASTDFEEIGHSRAAKEMMEKMYVGDIDTSTIPKKTKTTASKQPNNNQEKTIEFVIQILQFVVPVVVLGGAYGVRLFNDTSA